MVKDVDWEPVDAGKDYAEVRSEVAHRDAEAKGCVVVVPTNRQLFIDIDSKAALNDFWRCWSVFREQEQLHNEDMVRSDSPSGEKHHEHIVITLKRDLESDEERIMLQALLGSDPMREMLSWKRVKLGDKTPTLFFEKK
jgi:hypothetical protein